MKLFFSSNIISILKFNPEIRLNKTEIKNYFLMRHLTPFNDTCYENVKVLDPASFVKVNALNLKNKKEIFEDPLDWVDEKNIKINLKLSDLVLLIKLKAY